MSMPTVYQHPVKLEVSIGVSPDFIGSYQTPCVTPSLKNNPYLYVHTLSKRILYAGEAGTLDRLKQGFGGNLNPPSENIYGWRAKYRNTTLITYAFKLVESKFKDRNFRLALEAEILFMLRMHFGNWPCENRGFQPRPEYTHDSTVQKRLIRIWNQLIIQQRGTYT